jgi:hypothetical protein
VRTTLTLDDDLAAELNRTARLSGRSFKEVVNAVIRQGLSAGAQPSAAEHLPFVVQPKACGLQPGIDPLRLNQLLDQLDVEQFSVVQMAQMQHSS